MVLSSTLREASVLLLFVAPLGAGVLLCWRPRDRIRQWLVAGVVAVTLFAAFSPPAPGSGRSHTSGHAAAHVAATASEAAAPVATSQAAPEAAHAPDY